MTRIVLSVGFVIAGLALLAFSALDYFEYVRICSLFGHEYGPFIEVSQTHFEISDAVAGKRTTSKLVLKNRSARPVQIIGLVNC